ncbi:hypothetical protein BS50DRAFT_492524 [Corynespora cassiicola Philippines]|uniref:Uncharacterized protein n=1 Tax=Corynespora cassiicola Philippines TaxID=1448308 RepID=A0A2T2NSQ8_CORCC|nr:hypothetical protein BS50DRAFT_492524 [Corynespora cassiicola Philippines]
MRPIAGLLALVTHFAWTVNANVEKAIFLGPSPVTIPPNVHPSLDNLLLHPLSPLLSPILETRLPVQFPSAAAPHGLDSWYVLRDLDVGQRYEVRICWPATQPTDFWLDTFSLTEVFDTPDLISSLARYSEQRQGPALEDADLDKREAPPSSQAILFLRIQAAASYYSTNRTLMEHPPAVDVDIILDPFIFNVLPRSLAPVGGYITVVAIGAWFLSGFIYRWILSVAAEPQPKPHAD